LPKNFRPVSIAPPFDPPIQANLRETTKRVLASLTARDE
jgi:hypothetical protein